MKKATITGLIACGLIALGALLPWVQVNAGIISASKNGIEGDGVITLVIGLLTAGALLAWQSRNATTITSLIGGVIVFACAVYDIIDVFGKEKKTSLFTVRATVGIGLWMTLIGSLALIVAGAVSQREEEKVTA